MIEWKTHPTPIEAYYRFKEDDSDKLIDVGRYQRLVVRLIYLSLIKPNITYAMDVISQFMYAPTQAHMEVALELGDI